MTGAIAEQPDQTRQDRPFSLRHVSLLAILLTLYIFSYIDRSMISLLVDPIKQSLEITDFQISLLQGLAFGTFYALFGLPMGWLVDRTSRRWLIWGGVTFWSLASAACGLARNFAGLAVARFGVGAGEASLVPAAYALISTELPRRRVALGLAIFTLGSSLGTGAALILGGYLIGWAEAVGDITLPLIGRVQPWQLAFLATGPAGIAIAFLAFLLPEGQRRATQVAAAGTISFRVFLRRRRKYLFFNIVGLSLESAAAFAAAAWMPSYLMRVHELPVATAGLITGLTHGLTGVVGVISAGLIADREFARGVEDAHQRLAIFAMTMVLLIIPVAFSIGASLPVIIILIALGHLFVTMCQPLAAHIQLTAPPEFRGRVAAIKVMTQQLVGISLGPAMVALFTDRLFGDPKTVGYSIALTVLILAPLSILCLWYARRPSLDAAAEARAW